MVRVVHAVTALAIGHSLTLAPAATGVISLPTRPVETLIVSRPRCPRSMPCAPGGPRRGTHRSRFRSRARPGVRLPDRRPRLGLGSLLTTLLGFNLGIELTQLLVVALTMPSLIVLSRTPRNQQPGPTVRVVTPVSARCADPGAIVPLTRPRTPRRRVRTRPFPPSRPPTTP
ncbi:HupE/UreJ family protein [Streptomyces sp. ADMS]|nr:HupE/UreJ family protein [Streptomyces sp. ADMS]MDW4906620.1 HupE/UreJ family protein [Streptomyces sp. ADMS]